MQKPDDEESHNESLNDVLKVLFDREGMSSAHGSGVPVDALESKRLFELLEEHFDRLDPNKDGISKLELLEALGRPEKYSADEYLMLHLVSKYFQTIANMSDDQPGEQTRITKEDMQVLGQFLVHSNMSLADLQRWQDEYEDVKVGKKLDLPPMTGKDPWLP